MTVLAQQIVTADAKYSIDASGYATYDIHNDSGYNMAISFGRDTGILSADYYTSPHGVLFGVSPNHTDKTSVNSLFKGKLYFYTQTPLGGGVTTNVSSTPASCITIIGYQQGRQPQATVSLNRWNTVGNPVQSIMGGSTNLQNDGNAVGTSIIEATVQGDSTSAVSITNNAHAVFGTILNNALFELIGAAGNFLFASSGVVSIDNRLLCNLIIAETGNDMAIQVAIGHKHQFDVNGVDIAKIDVNGINIQSGGLTLPLGGISKIKRYMAIPVINGNTNYVHNFGVIPDFVFFTANGTSTTDCIGYNPATLSSTAIDIQANVLTNFDMLLIKF